jgi:hypothetical protein
VAISTQRNRLLYNNETLMVGPSPATGYHFAVYSGSNISGSNNDFVTTTGPGAQTGTNLIVNLHRVQDIGYSFNIGRTDVYQHGQLGRIDSIILDPPTVNLNFSYLQANLHNEHAMGLHISSGTLITAFKNFLDGTQDEKNYFIRIANPGLDVLGSTNSGDGVIGIGNGFLSSYATQGSVGSFPTSNITVEGLNMKFDDGTSGNFIPAVNPVDGTANTTWKYILPVFTESPAGLSGISALRPGDINVTINYNDGGVDTTDWKVQSYNINYNIGREPLVKLGSKYAFSREIRYPLTATASITADVGAHKTGSVVNLVNTNTDYEVRVNIKHPTNSSLTVCDYLLKGAKLDSQEFSSSIGPNKSVTLNFTTTVTASGETTKGVFLSGLRT